MKKSLTTINYGMAHCTQYRIKYDTLHNIVLEQIRACARKALAGEQEAAEH